MVSSISGTLGCSSQYEPEGQFWPNLGPGSFGVSSTGADSGAAESEPGGGQEGVPVLGLAGGNSGVNGSPMGGGSISAGTASTTCSLSVSVTTTAPGGNYRPRNVGAIWIADATGRFIKSLDVWGNRRLSRVTAWNAATRAAGVAGNKVDAITSATLTAHRAHNASWNCQDYAGKVAPDGTYRVYFEVTDSNNAGPNHFETFTKGPAPATLQSSATNFNGILLTFKP